MRHLSLYLLLFPVLMLVGCLSSREPQRGDLQTLHRSPLRHLTGDAYQLVGIFPDGTHALLTDSIFEIQRLFLVDLVAGTVETIPIEKQTFDRFVTVGNGIIVLLDGSPRRPSPLWVSPVGVIRELDYLDLVIPSPGDYDRITADLARVEQLISEGELDDLTELEVVRLRADQPVTRTEAFFNSRYYIEINAANGRDLGMLRDHATNRILRDDTRLIEPSYPGLSFDILRRTEAGNGINESRQIQRLTIHNGVTSYSYEFDVLEPFYYTPVIGDRLYILGNGVKFIELAPLVDAGGAGR